MSTLGSIGGAEIQSSLLSQLWSQSNATVGPAGIEKPDSDAGPTKLASRLQTIAEEAGMDEDTISAMREELKAAITQAVEEAEANGTDGNPHEAIHQAIDDTLSKFGLNADELRPDPPAGEGGSRPQGAPPQGPPPDQQGGVQQSGSLATSNASTGVPFTDITMLSALLESMGLVDVEA